jgi:malonyl-CoA O-methyltransferase
LAVQWFEEPDASLTRLCRLLKPGGLLAFSTLLADTFGEWRRAHAAEGLEPGAPEFAAAEDLQHFSCRGAALSLIQAHVVEPYADGAAFVRTLKAIGAGTPRAGRTPLSVDELKRVLRRFEAAGARVTYHVGYAMLQVPRVQHGVFVVGTDTDVGKTVVAACLTRTWDADYWKPVQTGAAEDPGDTVTVARLTNLPPERLHPPAYVFAAPLSPHAAAALEGATIELGAIAPPLTERPLVVEGAGGVLVPLNDQSLMIDLVQRLGLPVVVVARSTLGTINHTLLTLEALRGRGVEVLGVVMNGPPSASNREAIERYGQVRVLAEIPWTESVTPEWALQIAASLPTLEAVR